LADLDELRDHVVERLGRVELVRARRAQERLDLGEVSEDELALNRRASRSRF
jgi:hypothetical protein